MSSHLLVYIVKRLLVMIPTLFVIALVCFLVLNLAPGRPGQAGEAAQASGSEEARNQQRIFRETFNLDKPAFLNTYMWIEESEVGELIDEAIAPDSEPKDRLAARNQLEDFGAYIVPELISILQSTDDPEVRAFTINELVLNGQQRNMFLGTEDDIPREIRDEQAAISRHNQELSSWRVPVHWAAPPADFGNVWPMASPCTLPDGAVPGFCAVDDDETRALSVGTLETAQTPTQLLDSLAAKGKLVEKGVINSADGVGGEFVVVDVDGSHNLAAAYPGGDGALVVATALSPNAERYAATDRELFKTAFESVDTTFGAQVAEKTELWLGWYEEHEARFQLDGWETFTSILTDTRFYKYMSNLLKGDFGLTIKKRPVLEEILTRLKYSFTLSFLSVILIYFLSIPIGIFSAIKQHTVADQAITLVLFILYSLPTFFVGTLIVQYTPEWVPFATSGFETNPVKEPYLTTGARLWDICLHLVFPVLTMTYGGLAALSRYARTGLLDVIRADYIRTARAKGLAETTVILKHAVRNGMIPILTILGTLLPYLFGGSLVVEYIFEIDGIGRYMLQAIGLRDYAVIMGVLLISAVMTLIGLLVSDISYALVDPRITFD